MYPAGGVPRPKRHQMPHQCCGSGGSRTPGESARVVRRWRRHSPGVFRLAVDPARSRPPRAAWNPPSRSLRTTASANCWAAVESMVSDTGSQPEPSWFYLNRSATGSFRSPPAAVGSRSSVATQGRKPKTRAAATRFASRVADSHGRNKPVLRQAGDRADGSPSQLPCRSVKGQAAQPQGGPGGFFPPLYATLPPKSPPTQEAVRFVPRKTQTLDA